MKIIAISQRVDEITNYEEFRDALDEQWHKLFQRMNAILIPIPNIPENISVILEHVCPEAIVLSGGNNLVRYGGSAPQRDKVDEMLIEYAVQNKVPLLGVCRGMQSIAVYFGSSLRKVEGHIATIHEITGEMNRIVNSYHSYAIDQLGSRLQVIAQTKQGDIEAIQHLDYPITGIMWHPERIGGFDENDLKLIKEKLSL